MNKDKVVDNISKVIKEAIDNTHTKEYKELMYKLRTNK